LSYQEVSEVMQTTVPAIESLMHRAKLNLRKILEKETGCITYGTKVLPPLPVKNVVL